MAALIEIHRDAGALAEALAADVFAALRADGFPARPTLLGCPGGRSLLPTYAALGALARREGADLSNLRLVMMDEYLLPRNGAFAACEPGAHYSCRRFGHEQIRATLNGELPHERRIGEDSVWLPEPDAPEDYDRRIEAAGGIALFLLASGASDGHVAFNPPRSPRDSRTRVVALAETTRRDNLRTFPAFRSLDEVPRHGVSVGIATIAELSRRAVLVLTGADKRTAADRLRAAAAYEPDWPATIVHECRNARVLMDEAAAGAPSL
jgi:glucosamine-6-phosphate deaminase